MANVLIVGGGAAGLMAAGAAVRQGHKVTVLEHMDKPGQKILVTVSYTHLTLPTKLEV